jgi:hypothetical protein
MSDTPFRIEVVTVTGLMVASTFPLQLAVATAAAYVGDADGFPPGSIHDRVGLRTVLLRLYGELLAEAKRVELLDDEGVAWLIPAERVLAIRVIDPERTPGAPSKEEVVKHIGFQLRPTVAGSRRDAPVTPTPGTAPATSPDRPAGEVGIRPKSELD